MKKLLLTGAFALASFLTAQAQQTLLTQNFDGTLQDVIDQEWSIIDFDGDAVSGTNFGFFDSANAGAANEIGFTGGVSGAANFTVSGNTATIVEGTDSGFWSPFVVIPADATVATATYRVGAASATSTASTGHYEAYVILGSEIQDITTLAQFVAYVNGLTPNVEADYSDESEVVTIDLSEYAGEELSVIFRYNNSDAGATYLFVDDVTITSDGTAGVKAVTSGKVSVFPNPANDVVSIANFDNSLVNSVSIVDINGRTVKSVQLGGVANAQINVSDLAKGIYVMTISTDKGTSTKKLIKN